MHFYCVKILKMVIIYFAYDLTLIYFKTQSVQYLPHDKHAGFEPFMGIASMQEGT